MFLKKNTNNLRSLFTVFAVFALAVTVLWLGANNSTTNASTTVGDDTNAPATVFSNTAPITINDAAAASPYPSNISVTGLSTVTSLTVTLNGFNHTFPRDVDVLLVSPSGAKMIIMSDLGGSLPINGVNVTLSDAATNVFSDVDAFVTGSYRPANFGTVQDAFPAPAPAGPYATAAPGGAATLTNTFGGTTANGTWSLYVVDDLTGDTGTISGGWSLDITGGTPTGATRGRLNDFTGNGRTDFTNLVFTPNGPINWKVLGNPAAPGPNNAFIRIFNYGITGDGATFGDAIVVNDYVGDQKSEVAVYRDTNSTYYLAQFPTGTGGIVLDRAKPYGDGATDIPGAEGDYDGDGKADYTVIRQDANGNLTWFIMTTGTGTMRAIVFGSTVGIPSPAGATVFQGADFTGDGRDELIYVRRNSAGAVTYFIGDAVTGAGVRTVTFGNWNTDFSISPRDYTGDGLADFVAVRETVGANAVWYINNPVTNVTTGTTFGIASVNFDQDQPVRGDYDGDGRQDVAVWRPSNQTYYWMNSSNGSLQSQQWGAAGDAPLGAFGQY